MSEEKMPIKLKVDPQELHKNRPSKVQVSEEPAMIDDSATIGLKKHEIPVAINAVQPVADAAAQKSVEAQLNDIRKQTKQQTKERRKRVKTKAEAAYRKSVLLSIVVLLPPESMIRQNMLTM